ncbi:cell division protein FtsQ/DivIB [Candidatus Palauibacter sp.]|uniref:cell division protein FtsQ/DivIB n=1 Tax=Candidatus Palauibacter sp. TaxID=3101350 RepID=UPI003B029492
MIPPVWDPDDLARPAPDEDGERRAPRSRRMTRRGRRQLLVVLIAVATGFSVPIWVPRILATLPAFRIEEVRVVGTNHARPDEVRRLAAIAPDASVWDDPRPWESRVREHPLVREATARGSGFRALEISVVEERPVALVATPELRPASRDGRLLPLDPSSAGLDLPIIPGPVETDGDFVADPRMRELIATLERMDRTRRDFISLVSEVGPADEGGYRFLLLPGAGADVVLLPREDPLGALDRVSIALGQIEDRRIACADARFTGQVVMTRAEAR